LNINWTCNPGGELLTFDAGPLQARLYKGSGHFALVGPALQTRTHAHVILFAPPAGPRT
jgi:hypothetical protein